MQVERNRRSHVRLRAATDIESSFAARANPCALYRHKPTAGLAKCPAEHLTLTFPITAACQDLGPALAFVARADVTNEGVDHERATRAVAVQVPYLDGGLSGFH